jgi:hypothetical protein
MKAPSKGGARIWILGGCGGGGHSNRQQSCMMKYAHGKRIDNDQINFYDTIQEKAENSFKKKEH